MKKLIALILLLVIVAGGVLLWWMAPVMKLRGNLEKAVSITYEAQMRSGAEEVQLRGASCGTAGYFSLAEADGSPIANCYFRDREVKWDLRPTLDRLLKRYSLPAELTGKLLDLLGAEEVILPQTQSDFLLEMINRRLEHPIRSLPSPLDIRDFAQQAAGDRFVPCTAPEIPDADGVHFFRSRALPDLRLGVESVSGENAVVIVSLDTQTEPVAVRIHCTFLEEPQQLPFPENMISDGAFSVLEKLLNWIDSLA